VIPGGGHLVGRCSIYCVDVGGSRRHGAPSLDDGRGLTNSRRLVALFGVMVASTACLTKCMHIFDLRIVWWIDSGDDFFSGHHRGVRRESAIPDVRSRFSKRVA
jgi:hypothetical protein